MARVLLLLLALANAVPVQYCESATGADASCHTRGHVHFQPSATFTPNPDFAWTAFPAGSAVFVRAGGASAVAAFGGPNEELKVGLTAGGIISSVSLSLSAAAGAAAPPKFVVSVPEQVLPPRGPAPAASRPVKPAEGEGEKEEEEPGFLKKYWWAILLVYVLAQVVASAAEGEAKPENKTQ